MAGNIYGVRVTPNCDSINSFIICSADEIQTDPDVAFDSTNYLAVWSDLRVAGNNIVYGARVTQAGVVLDPEGIQIGPVNGSFQKEPSIAFIGDRYLVVWGHMAEPFGVTGRFIYPDGSLGDTIHIATPANVVHNTDVVYDGDKLFVVWTEYPGLLRGQAVSTTGSLIGAPVTIAENILVVGSGSLCFSGSEYLVTWSQWASSILELWGRRCDAAGNPSGPAFRISNPGAGGIDGFVAADEDHYLCVYSRMLYPADIYGNLDLEVGIEDGGTRVIPAELPRAVPATIINGPLVLPADRRYTVFDITGRTVAPGNLQPGIYFIEAGGEFVQKIIKIH